MSAVEVLKAEGPMTAAELARRLRRALVLIYCELVPAEGQGLVRLCADHGQRGYCVVRWEAM